jgi:sugar (pentulose or hexulose) kinase
MVQRGLVELEEGATMSLVGGGSSNQLWCQIIADVFQVPVVVHDQEVTTKASAVGAALQAAAIAQSVCVGEVMLHQLSTHSNKTLCYQPQRSAEICNIYEANLKRHVSISDSLFGNK